MNSRTAHGTVIMTIDEMMIVLYKQGNFIQTNYSVYCLLKQFFIISRREFVTITFGRVSLSQ